MDISSHLGPQPPGRLKPLSDYDLITPKVTLKNKSQTLDADKVTIISSARIENRIRYRLVCR